MTLHRDSVIAAIGLLALALVPPVASAFDQTFYIDFVIRTMIYAIAALSLGFILGYGGMSSFGHAVYLGVGAYSVAILSHYGISNGPVHFATAIILSACTALLVGAISLRTEGIHFIMITLAFGQMVYFLLVSLKIYGGDDGLNILRPSDFGSLLDLGNSLTLFYFVFAILAACVVLGGRIIRSRFGMALRGIKSNERRMAAIGFPTFRYKLTAFVIAGSVCGMAGALSANQALFVSPSLLHWTRSGELLIIVVVGGSSLLFGPVIGAIAYLTVEYVLAGSTVHWQGVLGTLLILLILFSQRGIVGLLPEKLRTPPRHRRTMATPLSDGRA
jgi:branched-chain amino acid transport system permease protein